MRHPQTSSPNRRPVEPSPCLKQGLAGPSVGQTVKESAIVQIAARRASKASRNRCCRAGHQVLVNAPLQAPIIERALRVV